MLQNEFLEKAVSELIKKYKCHTIILYGSRARGDSTSKSDYDLMGVRRGGKSVRLAEKWNGIYLDVFIFPEKALLKVDESHLYMKGAKILIEKNKFGQKFLNNLNRAIKKKYMALPADEIKARKFWLHKMLERAELGDLEGNYRRSWLHEALLTDYFCIRKKRYWGSKEGFAWLKKHDLKTYLLFNKTLKNPEDFKILRKLVERVSQLKI